MAAIHKKVAGFQLDEIYVGTPEERAAGDKPDNSIHPGREFTIGTNILIEPVGSTAGFHNWEQAVEKLSAPASFSARREKILDNIAEMRSLSKQAESDYERDSYEKGLQMEIQALQKLNEEESGLHDKIDDLELGEVEHGFEIIEEP
jgi:hypothetical protein